MIVNNLDLEGIAVAPDEADPPLLINPHAVLSLALAAKPFESVAGTRQVAQFHSLVKDSELAQRDALDVLR